MCSTVKTLYYTKTFTSGHLKGLSVNTQVTASDVSPWMRWQKGRDLFTKAAWIITDASFQKYDRRS